MQIRHMNATFGRLEQSELTLQPGLNVIYAPNESGKSTWSHFIRSMLYGINTRDRSPLADKNRFAPWSGTPMAGRMDVEADGDALTIQRLTRRAAAPMGDFSCTYTGTATPAPHVTAQNAGESLLGITPEVFARSAFITQSALAVDQDAELERRIAALITTGEEDTSYSEAFERLKKQLNQRRHNKTGQIPALERERDDLDHALALLDELRSEYVRIEAQLRFQKEQHTELTEQKSQWENLERQQAWSTYQQLRSQTEQAAAHLAALRELTGQLPDEMALAQMENRCAMLSENAQDIQQARQTAQQACEAANLAQQSYHDHPLYPADEEGLLHRIDNFVLQPIPSSHLTWILAGLSACAVVAAVVTLVLRLHPAWWIAAAAAGLAGGIGSLLWGMRRRRLERLRCQQEESRNALIQQMGEYLPLRNASRDASVQAAEAEHLYQAARKQQLSGIASLLTALAPYRSTATLDEAAVMVAELRRQKTSLDNAERTLQDLQLRKDLMEQHLPQGEMPDASPISQPAMTQSQLRAALAQTENNLRSAQTQLDTLVGQIRSMGDPDDLISRRAQKLAQLERLQGEYDAISLAMDALEKANLTLQNRFSPALGARAAEIFTAITGGKYHRVLLGRDFSLAAEAVGDPAQRNVRLLSQGATDQLYLSVRLAICDMVLPRDKSVPLIMDDALITFDDIRLHAALDYLLEESARRQILLFTCQRREQSYLAGREGVHIVAL